MSLTKSIDYYFFKYIRSRISKSSKSTIDRRKIFIMPTRQGFILFLFLLASLIACVLYQINLGLIIVIIASFVFFLTIIITHQNILGLEFKSLYQLIDTDGTQKLKLLSHNNDEQRINLDITDEHHRFVLNQVNFKTGDNEHLLIYRQHPRGVFQYPLIKIKTIFPFGIIQSWAWIQLEGKYIVYPTPEKPSYDLNLLIQKAIQKNQDSFEHFTGLKNYAEGMSESRIAWKVSQAKDQWLVKQFEADIVNEDILINFDLIPTMKFEKKLRHLSYIFKYCYNHKYNFGFKYKNFQSKLDRSYEHYQYLLKKLAEF